MIVGLDHINIVASDIDLTRDFFVDVLGLTVGPRPPFNFPGYWLYVGDRPAVHVQHSSASLVSSTMSTLNHAAFLVSDFDGLIDRLKSADVPYRQTTIPGSTRRQAFFLDPNGVRLELDEA